MSRNTRKTSAPKFERRNEPHAMREVVCVGECSVLPVKSTSNILVQEVAEEV